jgi:hypothetical protein
MAKSLNEALFNVQKTMPAIQKDSVNPHFKNSYVSLDKVLGDCTPRTTGERSTAYAGAR